MPRSTVSGMPGSNHCPNTWVKQLAESLGQVISGSPGQTFPEYSTKDFSSWKHFLCLSFGQLTHRESMSDAMLCLKLNSTKLFHLGIGKAFDKSTVSRANENRDWRIFQDFGLKLINQAKDLYQGSTQLDFNLEGNIFALDSTTVDLCLDIFW